MNIDDIPHISTQRLQLGPFSQADIPALADILAEPEVTKNITANASSPERCLAAARKRIGWHNGSWGRNNYGVWAVRARDSSFAQYGELFGWCGFAEPDIGEDPEILYALAPHCWGHGLGQEAAQASIAWLFSKTESAGISAVIFARLNPVSIAIVKKLGMQRRGRMAMSGFLPNRNLARDVLEYEIWRLGSGRFGDRDTLLFQAPFKAGQVVSLDLMPLADVEDALSRVARMRSEFAEIDPADLDRIVGDAFCKGLAEPDLDWYHRSRSV